MKLDHPSVDILLVLEDSGERDLLRARFGGRRLHPARARAGLRRAQNVQGPPKRTFTCTSTRRAPGRSSATCCCATTCAKTERIANSTPARSASWRSRSWPSVDHYAEAKTEVVEGIIARAADVRGGQSVPLHIATLELSRTPLAEVDCVLHRSVQQPCSNTLRTVLQDCPL